jgi:hypothetical protein
MTSKSKFIKYFNISGDVCKCLNCDYSYKSSKSKPTSSLRSHLKNAHKQLYKIIEEDERALEIEKEKIASEKDDENNNQMSPYDVFPNQPGAEPTNKILKLSSSSHSQPRIDRFHLFKRSIYNPKQR